MKLTRHSPQLYVLDPDQSLRDYKALERLWYRKIRASFSFQDIERLDLRGYSSDYSAHGSTGDLRRRYSEAQQEFYRRASIFLHDYRWSEADLGGYSPAFCRYLWVHYSSGCTLRHIVRVFNGLQKPLISGPRPRIRHVKGRPQKPPSLFFIHYVLHRALLPTFEAWCKGEGRDNLTVDWDLCNP